MGVQNKTEITRLSSTRRPRRRPRPRALRLAELEKTAAGALELSTVKKVQTEKRGRQRLECFSAAWRSPAASTTFAHLGVHGSGTGGKKCGCFHGKPVKSEMTKRKVEVTDELNRRAKERSEQTRMTWNAARVIHLRAMPRSSLHAARREFLLS